MEKIPMDPLVNKDTGKIEGYQYRLKFPEDTVTSANIEKILSGQYPTSEKGNSYSGKGFVLHVDHDEEEKGENPNYGNGDPYSAYRR